MSESDGVGAVFLKAILATTEAFAGLSEAFRQAGKFIGQLESRELSRFKRRVKLCAHRRHQDARRVAAKAGRRERTGRASDRTAPHA